MREKVVQKLSKSGCQNIISPSKKNNRNNLKIGIEKDKKVGPLFSPDGVRMRCKCNCAIGSIIGD
jgi:hypothetical protein